MFPSAKDLADHKIEEHKDAHFRSENTNSILSAKEFLKLPNNTVLLRASGHASRVLGPPF